MKTLKNPALLALMLLVATLISGCPGEAPEPEETTVEVETPPEAAVETDLWESGGLTVRALRDSPKFPAASLSLPGIEEGATLDATTVPFAFDVQSYALGEQTSDAATKGLANSAEGQHIHLIVDNGPYSAHYEAAFEQELEDGHHVVLAFLSRSYHESLKNPGAAVLTQFFVGEEGADEIIDLGAPHLFYSRPKGTYKGADTEKLMLDFYLANVELSADGYRVRATIEGQEFVFSEWIPYVIEGLPLGEIEITLELIDGDGNVVPGPFNSVSRSVTLEAADDEPDA